MITHMKMIAVISSVQICIWFADQKYIHEKRIAKNLVSLEGFRAGNLKEL